MMPWYLLLLLFMLLPPSVFAASSSTPSAGMSRQAESLQETSRQTAEALPTVVSHGLTPPESKTAASISTPAQAIPQVRTDPFQVSYFMQQKALAGNLGGLQFTPLQNPQVPTLIMRGIVSGGLALLDVEGHGVYMVREGDNLSLNRQGQNTVIKIEKIDRFSLQVKVGTLNETIVVR